MCAMTFPPRQMAANPKIRSRPNAAATEREILIAIREYFGFCSVFDIVNATYRLINIHPPLGPCQKQRSNRDRAQCREKPDRAITTRLKKATLPTNKQTGRGICGNETKNEEREIQKMAGAKKNASGRFKSESRGFTGMGRWRQTSSYAGPPL